MMTLRNIIELTGGSHSMSINGKDFDDSYYEHGKQEMLEDIMDRYGKDSLVNSFSQTPIHIVIYLDTNTINANYDGHNKTRTVCVRATWDYYQYFYNIDPNDCTDFKKKVEDMLATGEITNNMADFCEAYIDDDQTW